MDTCRRRTEPRRLPLCGAALAIIMVASGCGPKAPDDGYALAFSESLPTGRRIELRYIFPFEGADCAVDTVSVTGPFIETPLALPCLVPDGGNLGASVDIGLATPELPLTYAFTVRVGDRTLARTATVNCFLAVPDIIEPAPGATVTSPVTLRWVQAPETGIDYELGPLDAGIHRAHAVVDRSSVTIEMTPGGYYWDIWAAPIGLHDGSSTLKCASRSGGGFFVIQ